MADLDRTTFYRSFESKDDVLDYYLDRQMTLLAGQLPAYSTLEKPDCAVPLDVCGAKEPLCPDGLPSDQFFSDALSEKIILVLISNIEVGDARQFVMARFIAGRKSILPQLVHRGIYGFFNSWRYGNFAERPEDLAKCMASFYLH